MYTLEAVYGGICKLNAAEFVVNARPETCPIGGVEVGAKMIRQIEDKKLPANLLGFYQFDRPVLTTVSPDENDGKILPFRAIVLNDITLIDETTGLEPVSYQENLIALLPGDVVVPDEQSVDINELIQKARFINTRRDKKTGKLSIVDVRDYDHVTTMWQTERSTLTCEPLTEKDLGLILQMADSVRRLNCFNGVASVNYGFDNNGNNIPERTTFTREGSKKVEVVVESSRKYRLMKWLMQFVN